MFEAKPPLLEVELHSKLQDAIALPDRGCSKVGVCLGERVTLRRVLDKVQREITAVWERPQRMVEEVVPAYPKLHVLGLGDLKVLENGHVPIEVGGPIGNGQQRRPVLSDHCRRSEATAIHELVRPQP